MISVVNWGCAVRMVVDSILPHAEFGPNDDRRVRLVVETDAASV